MKKSCSCKAMTAIRLHRRGMADCQSGDLDSAIDKLKTALAEIREIGLEGYQIKILNNLGVVCELKGDRRQARQYYQSAVAAAGRRLGPRAKLTRIVGANLARVA